jgi:hypothetical protein
MISFRTPFIREELWGRDHKSTLLYVETRAVDHAGVLGNAQLRIDASRHPTFLAPRSAQNGKDYPTRLRDGYMEYDHDDLDCILDMWAAGFVAVASPAKEWWDVAPGARGPIKLGTYWPKGQHVVCMLTGEGWVYAQRLRRARAEKPNPDPPVRPLPPKSRLPVPA